jgi:F-type H+-transporting ATPase subunit b
MLVNWFTVAAQALNFIVLVWLMKRFLYRPILDAIDTRERRITTELAEADRKKAEAEQALDEFQAKTATFDREREACFKRMTEEVETERLRLLAEARKDAEADGAKHREALISETKALERTIGLRVQDEVFNISRKALWDLSGASLEERMVEVFAKHLGEIDEPTKAALSKVLEADAGPAIARSAFDLSEDQKGVIQEALKDALAGEVPLRFETNPELIGGISLSLDGHKVSWTIADYITALEEGVDDFLKTASDNPNLVGAGAETMVQSP